MKINAIRDLAQFSDKKLFNMIAIGLNLLSEHIVQLSREATILFEGKNCVGSLILR